MKYTLHCFAESGNAYKAALMLNLCGADWEAQFVDFFNGGSKTEEYLALNELGEVPVLEAGDLVLSQSGVILDYLADTFEMFDSESVPEHREIMRWMFFDNHKLTGNLSTLRYLRAFTENGDGEVANFLVGRVNNALKIVDNRLADKEFIIGERPTIADVSMCGYMFFLDEAKVDTSLYPNVMAWLDRIKALPNWSHPYDLMPKRDAE
ncbi:MAG: glutathione S-transferase N-terminal domain-containing protein [Gammaproteobacteria bacterium]|nr:glutathione S-transferase N-terminal domain-containing protein [Gammaproteobacteria bacterium]